MRARTHPPAQLMQDQKHLQLTLLRYGHCAPASREARKTTTGIMTTPAPRLEGPTPQSSQKTDDRLSRHYRVPDILFFWTLVLARPSS